MIFKFKRELSSVYRLFNNETEYNIFSKYILHNFYLRVLNRHSLKKYDNEMIYFRNKIKLLDIDNDLFSGNIRSWLRSLNTISSDMERRINYLEIGSWQGVSSVFMLDTFKNLYATCVDTWEGSDEDRSTSQTLASIETKFDSNTQPYTKRITKVKSTSFNFFSSNSYQKKFDVIYIDGSHHADDVLIDGLKAFQLLKKGGLLIFDDYTWKYYSNPKENPTSAINAFMKLKRGSYKILDIHRQVHLMKL